MPPRALDSPQCGSLFCYTVKACVQKVSVDFKTTKKENLVLTSSMNPQLAEGAQVGLVDWRDTPSCGIS